ncbi:DNA repair protein RecO (recombination protein O) [Lachnospiraceae bacterium PF1-21]|uniref:DNA repair protein RecO n=1 Tax=Ohessyouella blattaphilus TaxID=2949333 RepID=UPI003E2F008D
MNTLTVTGMVIGNSPAGEYDRRVVLITRERGKISAFARGARKQNNALVGMTDPFTFGEFSLYEGRSSYTLTGVKVQNFFTELRTDMIGAYYGMYFLDLANYYAREGLDETETLKLLYQSLRALISDKLPNSLVRSVFELKLIMLNGEGPQAFRCLESGEEITTKALFSVSKGGVLKERYQSVYPDAVPISDSALYTLQFISSSRIQKLYSFVLKPEVAAEIGRLSSAYLAHYVDKEFKSRTILETIIS